MAARKLSGSLFISLIVACFFVARFIWSSDLIFYEGFYRDITTHFPLDGWRFPGPLFVFPDGIFYFFLRSFLSNLNILAICYCTTVLFSVALFFKVNNPKNYFYIFIFWIVAFFAMFSADWWAFLPPFAHGGALIVGLFYSFYFLTLPKSWLTAIVLCLVGSLSAASDMFFGVQFLVPLAIISIWQISQRQISQNELKLRVGIGGATNLMTFAFYKFFFLALGIQNQGFGDVAPFLFQRTGILLRHILTYRLKLIAYGFALYRCLKGDCLFRKFLLLSSLSSLIFVILADLWVDSYNVRYLMPFAFFFCWEAADFLVQEAPWKAKFIKLIVITLFILAGDRVYKMSKVEMRWPFHVPSNRQLDCLNEAIGAYQLKLGYADYWLAKLPMFLSVHPLTIIPVDMNLKYFHWMDNSRWYPKDLKGGDFIFRNLLAESPSVWAIKSTLGEPKQILDCPNAEVWIYK